MDRLGDLVGVEERVVLLGDRPGVLDVGHGEGVDGCAGGLGDALHRPLVLADHHLVPRLQGLLAFGGQPRGEVGTEDDLPAVPGLEALPRGQVEAEEGRPPGPGQVEPVDLLRRSEGLGRVLLDEHGHVGHGHLDALDPFDLLDERHRDVARGEEHRRPLRLDEDLLRQEVAEAPDGVVEVLGERAHHREREGSERDPGEREQAPQLATAEIAPHLAQEAGTADADGPRSLACGPTRR